MARTGRDGGCGLDGARTGICPGWLMTGVRAGLGRMFAISFRRLGGLLPSGGDRDIAASGAIVVVGDEERGELDDSVFSVS